MHENMYNHEHISYSKNITSVPKIFVIQLSIVYVVKHVVDVHLVLPI